MEELTQLIRLDERANDTTLRKALEEADSSQKLKEELRERLQEAYIETTLPEIPVETDESSKRIENTIEALKDVRPEAIGPYLDEIVNKYLNVNVEKTKKGSIAIKDDIKNLESELQNLLAKVEVYYEDKGKAKVYDKTAIADLKELAEAGTVDAGDAERYISLVKRVNSTLKATLVKKNFAGDRAFKYTVSIVSGVAVIGSIIGALATWDGQIFDIVSGALAGTIVGGGWGLMPGMIAGCIVENSITDVYPKKYLRKYMQEHCKTLDQDILLAEMYGKRLRSQLENPKINEDHMERLEEVASEIENAKSYLSSALITLNKLK